MRPSDNPFNITRREKLCRFRPPDGWPDLIEKLRGTNWRGALIGPHGHGKSTLLGVLADRLVAEEGVEICKLHLNSEQPRLDRAQWGTLRKVTPNTVICLDGAEQLGVLYWQRVKRQTRQARGLIITTHQPGRLPTLMRCTSTPELLNELVDDLTADTGLDLPHDFREVHERHHGNLRDALDELYDYCQNL